MDATNDPFRITGYVGSRDYERLADLARTQSVICIVDYERSMRDIGRTMYRSHGNDEYWEVGARGTGYIVAFERDEFIRACRALNVEFLDPAPASGERNQPRIAI